MTTCLTVSLACMTRCSTLRAKAQLGWVGTMLTTKVEGNSPHRCEFSSTFVVSIVPTQPNCALDIWTWDNWTLGNWTPDFWSFHNWTSVQLSCPEVQLSKDQLSKDQLFKSSVVHKFSFQKISCPLCTTREQLYVKAKHHYIFNWIHDYMFNY